MSEETKTDAAEKPVVEKPNDTEPLGVIRSFYEANASDELRKMHAKHRKDKTFPELLKRRVA